MAYLYKPDLWFYPLKVTTANRSIRYQERVSGVWGPAKTVNVLTSDEYWVFSEHNIAIRTAWDCLFYEIGQAMSNGSVGTSDYSLFRNELNPALSGVFKYQGVTVYNPFEGIDGFRLLFTDPGFTMDPRIFGADGTQDYEILQSGSFVYSSPHTGLGSWLSPDYADTKFPWDRYDQQSIAAGWGTGQTTRHGTKKIRNFQYSHVPGGHTFADRNQVTQWAENAGLNLGDGNNAFEHLWRSIAAGSKAVVVHDHDWEGVNGDVLSGGAGIEVVWRDPDWGGFDDQENGGAFETMRLAGEAWKLRLKVWSAPEGKFPEFPNVYQH